MTKVHEAISEGISKKANSSKSCFMNFVHDVILLDQYATLGVVSKAPAG